MTGPLQRVGQAIGRFLGRRGPPAQRVYREPIGKPPKEAPQGPINRPLPPEQRQQALYRVGINPRQKGRIDPASGERFLTGQYPTKAGVEGALRRVRGPLVQVRAYGRPAWEGTSPVDELGNKHITFKVPKAELEAALQGPGDIEDVVFQAGGYNFQRVLTVWVGEA